jgi:SET domain
LRLPLPIREEIFKLSIRQDIERYIIVGIKLILDGERGDIIPKIIHLDDVLSTNTFSLSPDDLKSPAGLFLNTSRFNYLCVPNADPFYNDKSGYKSVFANRDVDIGEEITISYLDYIKPRVIRQVDIRAWGFIY